MDASKEIFSKKGWLFQKTGVYLNYSKEREVMIMINYYTLNNGTRWTFNWAGDPRKCPSKVAYAIISIAPTFATKEDAENWVRKNLT